MNIEFFVPGVPVPKGSFTPVRRGKYNILLNGGSAEAHERHLDWAHRVAFYGAAWMRAHGVTVLLDEPLMADVTFYLPRPKSVPKRRIHPAVKPDGDKLLRGIFDPLKGVIYREDSRIVGGSWAKVYADEQTPPGALVRLWTV